MGGYRQTQEDLEKVSSKKSNLDHKKGQTLEEISDMVRVLTKKIAEKKGNLAPIIKELRPLRQQAQVGYKTSTLYTLYSVSFDKL